MQTHGKHMEEHWYRPDYYYSLSGNQLAWELLRRNEQYVRDWSLAEKLNSDQMEEVVDYWLMKKLIDPNLDALSAKVEWSYKNSVKVLTPEYVKRNFVEQKDGSTACLKENDFSPYVILELDSRIPFDKQEPLIRTILNSERAIQNDQDVLSARKKGPNTKHISDCIMTYDGIKAEPTYLEVAKYFDNKFKDEHCADLQSEASSLVTKRQKTAQQAILHYYWLIAI